MPVVTPIRYHPGERHILRYEIYSSETAPGIPLSHQFHRSRRWLAAQLQIIGRALATLHNAPETLRSDLRQNSFTKEAKVVKRASEHIQVLLPDTYNKIIEIVDKAEEHYSGLSQEKPLLRTLTLSRIICSRPHRD